MSLKTAEYTKGNRIALTSPWSWSIKRRLTFLYIFSTFGILVLATVSLYWVLVSNLEREDNQFLADQIHILRVILQEYPDNPKALEQEIKWEGSARQYIKYYARVLDEEGRTLVETPGMGYVAIEPASFPSPSGITETPERGVKWRSRDSRSYLLMAAWADVGHSGGKQRLIQVVLDVSPEKALIEDYKRKLAIVLFLGMLFSAGASILIAHKGMQPLEEITKAAHRITSTQLHERIGSVQWPKELKDLATAFDEMLSRIEDSFIRLSQFSADLAHELRTPINNLIGEAEVALSKNRTSEEYRQVLESSLEEYARLSRMIDSLLFLARAESAETQIERVLFDARKEIETVREFYDAVAEEQGVEVTCQGEASLYADLILFRRALSNLLANALQYTPSGGKITVSAQPSDDQYVEVSVSDTGSGIEPEHLPRLFDRFYRVDRSRSQYPQGAGLGLAIIKSIIYLHSGTVSIQSEPGKGTTVTLRFPLPD